MWTEQHRKIYQRVGRRYPSDMTDGEWVRLETVDPDRLTRRASTRARHARGDERDLDPLRTGCPWRYLPRDGFPPRSTVYNIFRKFQRAGVWESSGNSSTWHCVKTWARGEPHCRDHRQPIAEVGGKGAVMTV